MNKSAFTVVNKIIIKVFYGGVAQLGEHLPCTQRVRSSSLLISTKNRKIRKEPKQLNSETYFQSRKKGHKVNALAHEGDEGRK